MIEDKTINLNELLHKLDKYNNYDLISINKIKEIINECDIVNIQPTIRSVRSQIFTKLP